jgi:hypothetical protein
MANNPPPFIPPDLRVSPSGPYIAGPELGGAIVRAGFDCVAGSGGEINDLVIPGPAVGLVPRTQAPNPAAPLAVTFLEWESTDVLFIVWHVSGFLATTPADTPPVGASIHIQPTIDIGAGPQLIDPAGVGGLYPLPFITNEVSGGINLAGICAIRLTDPAQPPIVQLAYFLSNTTTPVADPMAFHTAGPLGASAPEAASVWLAALELDAARVFQLPAEVTTTPLVVVPPPP